MVIAVVAAVIQSGRKYGEVLIRRHGASCDCGEDEISNKYEFPGGKIEDGETLEEALCREVKEEINIELETKGKFKPRVVHAQVNKYKYSEDSYLVVFMECFTKDKVIADGDISDSHLVELSNIGDFETLPGTVEAIRNL